MAQTKKKRNRKHRGTQSGRVDSGRAKSRPRSRQEAKSQARAKGASRHERPPTWTSAAVRGVVAAVIFVVLVLLVFRRPASEALAFGAFMLLFYIPAGYYMDQFIWRRKERARLRTAQPTGKKQTSTAESGGRDASREAERSGEGAAGGAAAVTAGGGATNGSEEPPGSPTEPPGEDPGGSRDEPAPRGRAGKRPSAADVTADADEEG